METIFNKIHTRFTKNYIFIESFYLYTVKTIDFFQVFWYYLINGGAFMIIRPDYINAITPYIDVNIVKILTGVRRCGKSTILEMIQAELQNKGIPKENIISKRYTEMDIDKDYTAKEMYAELKSLIENKGRCYLFIDEPQEVNDWEKVINNLFENEDVDIYITGANSKLMSSEISTYLSGRYVTINCYTL